MLLTIFADWRTFQTGLRWLFKQALLQLQCACKCLAAYRELPRYNHVKPAEGGKKYTFQPVGTFSIKQLIQYQQLWTCSRSSYLVWTVLLRCTIHLFSLQLTRWIILRSDKGFCSKRCLWNRGNVQAFFIVRLFGHNSGNLMNMLADGAPQEAGVNEQRHRGREERGCGGGGIWPPQTLIKQIL